MTFDLESTRRIATELAAAEAKATEGPWNCGPYYKSDVHGKHGATVAQGVPFHTEQGRNNAAYIVACRNAEPGRPLLAACEEIQQLRADLAAMQADHRQTVLTLDKEIAALVRDRATKKRTNELLMAASHDQLCEIERLRAENARMIQDKAKDLVLECGEQMMNEMVKLRAFKAWVHDYLDKHDVPHHPPGAHGAAGCRIGDRMDWLMELVERLRKVEKTCMTIVDQIEPWMLEKAEAGHVGPIKASTAVPMMLAEIAALREENAKWPSEWSKLIVAAEEKADTLRAHLRAVLPLCRTWGPSNEAMCDYCFSRGNPIVHAAGCLVAAAEEAVK